MLIYSGGQNMPIKKLGERLMWKNAQKKLKKNKISDTINKMTP